MQQAALLPQLARPRDPTLQRGPVPPRAKGPAGGPGRELLRPPQRGGQGLEGARAGGGPRRDGAVAGDPRGADRRLRRHQLDLGAARAAAGALPREVAVPVHRVDLQRPGRAGDELPVQDDVLARLRERDRKRGRRRGGRRRWERKRRRKRKRERRRERKRKRKQRRRRDRRGPRGLPGPNPQVRGGLRDDHGPVPALHQADRHGDGER